MSESKVELKERMEAPYAEMHGHKAPVGWPAPFIAVKCDEEARPGYATKKAHEYIEDPETLKLKIKMLADMLRKSKNCIAYTGAGISTAAGIGDYASKAKDSVSGVKAKKEGTGFDAMPTYAHRSLVALYNAGILKRWIQQNHDGLPQKAGLPQEAINEIHGAWYDPSNPVVPMSGSLRDDLCADMYEWEKKTDLCLAMGSSLCGMNADRVAVTPAKKALKGKGVGTVIVALQQTQYDDIASLRIFAKIDDVMKALMQEMDMESSVSPMDLMYVPKIPESEIIEEDVFWIPFDAEGMPTKGKKRKLNLKKGAIVYLTSGPNKGCPASVIGKDEMGHYRVRVEITDKRGEVVPKVRKFGSWWIESAIRGNGILPETGIFPLVSKR